MTPEQAAERICWKVLFSNDDEAFKDVLDIIHAQRAEAVAEAISEIKAIWRKAGALWYDAFKNGHNVLSCDNCGYVDISIDDYLVCPNHDCTEELVNPQKVDMEHLRHYLLLEHLFPEERISPAPQEGQA